MLRAIAELSGAAPAASLPRVQPEPKAQNIAERRQLTVMFWSKSKSQNKLHAEQLPLGVQHQQKGPHGMRKLSQLGTNGP